MSDTQDRTVEVEFPAEEFAALQRMARERGSTLEQAIRQALVNDRYLKAREREGEKVLLQKRDRTFTRVELR